MRWWWLAAIGFVVTFVSTAVFVGTPTREYESRATLVIQPVATEEDDQIKALDALVQSGTVAETYASIARSSLIRHRAEDAMGRAPARGSVSAEVVTGTRLIRLAVTAKNPGDAQALAGAVREQTIDYVDALGDNYRLEELDAPKRANSPLPTRRNVTLALGGLLGLILGFGLAVVADNLWLQWNETAAVRDGLPVPGLWTPPGKASGSSSVAPLTPRPVLGTHVDHGA
jgi:capsular polysaccharide biosynthesis protein